MRRIGWIVAAVMLAACTNEARLTVVAEGLSNDTLFVEQSVFEERVMARGDRSKYERKVDTLLLGEESATLLVEGAKDRYLSLSFAEGRSYTARGWSDAPAARVDLILQPGEQVKLYVKPRPHGHLEVKVEGSELNAEIARMDNQMRSVQVDMHAIGRALNEAIAAKESHVADSLRNRLMTVRSAMHSIYTDYITAHPASEASAYCFYQMGARRNEHYYDNLDKKIFRGVFRPVQKLTELYLEEQEVRAEFKEKIVEGAEAPDFALLNPEGKTVTLSSHRGKWVVLDFWGSWCSWCIKGMPKMKQAYESCRDRMEIIGVACGDKPETWRNAIEKMQLPWVQVIDPMDAPIEESVSARYGVEGYPTKVLINPEGQIHKIFLGERPEFYEELKAVVK